MTTAATDNPIATLNHLLADHAIAMLTTTGEGGALESRPMASQPIDPEGCLWFFASRRSYLITDIGRDARVNVAFADGERQRYVSVSGEAEVVDDRAKRHELWQAQLTAWFPAGVDDPDLVLIQVRIGHADFWEGPGGAVRRLAGFAKSLLTGNRERSGTHGRIVL
jgi:general stress protein 26